jgi:hypothetical protein
LSLLDTLMRPVKAVRKKLAERKQTKMAEDKKTELIDKWKIQFESDRRAKSPIDSEINENEEYYQGKRTFGNLRDEGYNQSREVRTVINLVRTPIEALIDLSVPQPDLSAVARDDEYAVKVMNRYVDYVCKSQDLEEINLENERRVKKFGGAFYKVHWNNAIKYGSYVGDIEISNPHPKHIIPNAGCISMDAMEHYHHVINQTQKYTLRRWKGVTKEDLEDKAILYTEYDELADGTNKVTVDGTTTSSSNESGLKRYTIIETSYLDDDGDMGKLWWSGELLLDHTPKFYWHRDDNGEPTDVEILELGTLIRTGIDDAGQPIMKAIEEISTDTDMQVLDAAGNLIGIKVDYYIPTGWDIIYQPYLPKDLSFWGTSMIDDIKDLYESILKAVYIQEESFLRGRKKIITDNDEDAKKIMDPGTEVIRLVGTVKEIDIGTTIDGIGWINWLWSQIQLITGATNSAMGIHDPGVKSGKQAQLYVSQANFKANLASTYKAIAYRKLYRTVSDFAMAFCDDDRPFRLSGEKNKPEYGKFSRLSMLRDDSGNVIYPNWDISVSAQAGFLQNKSEVFNQIVQLASQHAFEPTAGNVAYLKVLQKLGVPYMESIVRDLEEALKKQEEMVKQQQDLQRQQMKIQQQNQGQNQQNQPQAPQAQPPSPEEIIKQLPVQQQAQMMQMLQTDPQQAMAMIQKIMGGIQNG